MIYDLVLYRRTPFPSDDWRTWNPVLVKSIDNAVKALTLTNVSGFTVTSKAYDRRSKSDDYMGIVTVVFDNDATA